MITTTPLVLAAAAITAGGDVSFAKQTLTKDFVAEGCAVADFNHDGKLDVASGRFIWLGPEFKQQIAYTPERRNPAGSITQTPYRADTGYSDYFIQFAHDFNGDGWPEVLVYGAPGEPVSVFENSKVMPEPAAKPGPKAASKPAPRPRLGAKKPPAQQPAAEEPADSAAPETSWTRHDLYDVCNGESPDFKDIDGDGKPELLFHTGGQIGYATIDWANPFARARFHAITPKSLDNDQRVVRYMHGYGVGDVNRDGRIDIVEKGGWYEQPADITSDSNWAFHPANFGEGGAQMYVYDVNSDGRNDVISGIKAHDYGLSWFEQNADGSFTEHAILGRNPEENANGAGFSQIHAIQLVDINGDGALDIVAGKRRWAHGPMGDVEPMGDPVICWFELKREAGGDVKYVKHAIDADSGVGTQFWTGDINGDGKPDAVVGNKHGVFVFTQK